jgi:hypothetical protein
MQKEGGKGSGLCSTNPHVRRNGRGTALSLPCPQDILRQYLSMVVDGDFTAEPVDREFAEKLFYATHNTDLAKFRG